MQRPFILVDTACGSLNNGDEIIMDSVYRELHDIIENPDVSIYRIPSHTRFSKEHKELLKLSRLNIVGGSNLFQMNYSPLYYKNNAMKIGLFDLHLLRNNMLFFGVGTTLLPSPASFKGRIRRKLLYNYSKMLWTNILNKTIPHSVRDRETADILKELGFENVINTGCPTIWRLNEEHCSQIPAQKARNAVLTFTGYKTVDIAPEILRIVAKSYDGLYIWPQSMVDFEYIRRYIEQTGVEAKVLPSTLPAYDKFLDSMESLDYIGTRLHGGIRALQHKKRTLIIAIDSRARSFRRDFGLPVIDKEDLFTLEEKINSKFETSIMLRKDRISFFREALESFINKV